MTLERTGRICPSTTCECVPTASGNSTARPRNGRRRRLARRPDRDKGNFLGATPGGGEAVGQEEVRLLDFVDPYTKSINAFIASQQSGEIKLAARRKSVSRQTFQAGASP